MVERVIVTAVRTSDKDTAASLAKQLGLTERAADNFAQRVGDGNDFRLSEQGADVGRLFRTVEQGLKEQAKFEIEHSDRPNEGPDSADCSETTCRIAFPQGTFPQGFSVHPALPEDANRSKELDEIKEPKSN